MKYGNRSVWRGIISSPITLVAAAIILVVLVRAAVNIHAKANESAIKLASAQAEYNKLQSRDSELNARVGYLSTDQGVESEIRSKYRGLKEGESLAVIVDESQTASSSTNANQSAAAIQTPISGRPWWRKLLGMLGF